MANCIKCNAKLPENAVFCHICGRKQSIKPRTGSKRSNGEGSVYKRGKSWQATVVLGYKLVDGVAKPIRVSKGGFKTKKDAINYIPILRQDRPRKVPTLNDLWYQFCESHNFEKLSKSRQEKYWISWRKIEKESFVHIDLITVADLQKMVDTHANSYYPARDIKDLLSKLFQLALPDKYITVNLAEFIQLPELNEKERQAFSREDIARLWSDYAAGNWFTGYILLMLTTGMMPGELLSARKDAIDWQRKQIVGIGLKTKKRKQTPIVLADIILPVLADLCNRTSGEKLIAINKDNFYDKYYETLERAGCKRLTPYSCRHTAATTLATENIAPSVLQKIMRHARFSTTEHYIHIDVDPMLQAVNMLKKPE